MSLEVPPTSMKMPSLMRAYINAAATPAAGPERMVRMGRRCTSSMLITPPSLRMIINGEVIPAALTARAVISAVCIIFGRMLALITAVRVRMRNP